VSQTIGWQKRVLEQGVFDVRQQQFLMLLFVVDPKHHALRPVLGVGSL
jgi:hypothetical protein